MTTQPDRIPLDDLTSDQLDALYDDRDAALKTVEYFDSQSKRRKARVTALEQRVTELTAGQCTHTLAICQQHHRIPVTGCPYPQCLAAAAKAGA